MEKNVLNLYLKKIALGDPSYNQRVCHRLANRLIFAPAIQLKKDHSVIYEVEKFNEEGKEYVPVFTTEKYFKEWCETNNLKKDVVSVLGADFCAALNVNTWIKIDSGAPHQVMLSPEIIDEIACAPIDEQVFQDKVDFNIKN